MKEAQEGERPNASLATEERTSVTSQLWLQLLASILFPLLRCDKSTESFKASLTHARKSPAHPEHVGRKKKKFGPVSCSNSSVRDPSNNDARLLSVIKNFFKKNNKGLVAFLCCPPSHTDVRWSRCWWMLEASERQSK